jgi:hypothetical protein
LELKEGEDSAAEGDEEAEESEESGISYEGGLVADFESRGEKEDEE